MHEIDVARYLLDRGLLDASSVVDGDVRITDVSRRNRNYVVARTQATSYLVKIAERAEQAETLAREAAVYAYLAGIDDRRVRLSLATCYLFDPVARVLVLELFASARTLRGQQAGGRYSRRVAAGLGRSLAALHANTADARSRPSTIQPLVPSGLSVHRPWLDWMADMSAANVHLIRVIQQADTYCDLLDGLRDGWRAPCLIHGDCKGDNFLVLRSGRGEGRHVRIIDWELAGPGDPYWDVGSVLGDYLATWLLSIPFTGEDPPERFATLARFPLETIRPAMRTFWAEYVRHAKLEGGAARDALIRSTRYAAARLVQTAYEQTHAMTELIGTTYCLLQVSFNMLRRPEEAAVRLLGLPSPTPA